MRKVFLFASALMLSLSFTSCERIDAGCEGILVNLYGSERGVDDVSMVTGRVFYNPATQEVYEAEAKKKIVVAEAKANASLTPLLVKKQWIEAWDGHLPKVTGNSSTLVGLDN